YLQYYHASKATEQGGSEQQLPPGWERRALTRQPGVRILLITIPVQQPGEIRGLGPPPPQQPQPQSAFSRAGVPSGRSQSRLSRARTTRQRNKLPQPADQLLWFAAPPQMYSSVDGAEPQRWEETEVTGALVLAGSREVDGPHAAARSRSPSPIVQSALETKSKRSKQRADDFETDIKAYAGGPERETVPDC
uniref:WW domain-containing protein n=1 Tax=Macrostomum lignano TaxID=282301 RepID=A0A1I8FGS9_9PLAT